MRQKAFILLALFALACSACYHQTVQTGRTPSPTTVQKRWTATWLWGLVPAGAIDVTSNCPGGIATVQTKLSFLNGVATLLTLGIYTPRDVSVTCATASEIRGQFKEFIVFQHATTAEQNEVLNLAIAESSRTQQLVLISVRQ